MKNDYKKYDVVMVDFGTEGIGSEQKNIRPALIVQNNKGNYFSSCTIVIPITSMEKSLHIPTHALIKRDSENGLKNDSMLLGEQIRVISEQRILKKIGAITKQTVIDDIDRARRANFD